ncbi:MAG: hypothetical protein WD407_03830, partial [Rhodospirillales bacterium]
AFSSFRGIGANYLIFSECWLLFGVALTADDWFGSEIWRARVAYRRAFLMMLCAGALFFEVQSFDKALSKRVWDEPKALCGQINYMPHLTDYFGLMCKG